jgi:hypothetical protein
MSAALEPPDERCIFAETDGHHCDLTPGRGFLASIDETQANTLTGLYNLAVECSYPVCGYGLHPEDAARLAEVYDDAAGEIRSLFAEARIVPTERQGLHLVVDNTRPEMQP